MARRGLLILLLLLLACGCARQTADNANTIVVWGLQFSADDITLEAQVKEFERRTGTHVKVLSMGAGAMNPQKLMTAIVGRTPPDVIYQDRFTIGDWASRDTFRSLDDLLAPDRNRPDGVHKENFYPATWAEATYQGHTYAIPAGCDDRVLYWNRTIFNSKADALRKAGLDPTRAPRTWDEVLAYAKVLTDHNPDGSFKSIGFIPNWGNSWLYLYSWQNDGEFMSADGRTCTLNNPQTVEALQYMVRVHDELGGTPNIAKFQSGFRTAEQDPFIIGKVAMKVDGDWILSNIARYGPDLNFGTAPAPVPADRLAHKGRFANDPTYITWAGGFSYAIPVGAKHIGPAWDFIRWMTSVEAARVGSTAQSAWTRTKGRMHVIRLNANIRVNEMLKREFVPREPRYREALELHMEMMKYAKFRPVTFVGQLLWDEHVRAFDAATYHESTHLSPQQALAIGQGRVQRELNHVYGRELNPRLNWRIPIGVIGVVAVGLIVLVVVQWRRTVRLGRLGRTETGAAYVFISPWLIGFLVFTLGPVLASIIFSFCDYDVLHPARWIGAGNYAELATNDLARLGLVFYNAAYVAAFGIPLNIVTGLAIAMLLNTGVRGMPFYRTAYYMPSIVPVIASAVLWSWVLNGDPNQGLLNAAWKSTIGDWFHMQAPGWLQAPEYAKPALIIMGLWGAGGGMILWLAGLQGIPKHLYEAADLDGASPARTFWSITLPQLSPYMFFNLIMGVIGALQEFDRIYVLGGGGGTQIGPNDSLLMPVYYLFSNGFTYFKMGYASALAWIIFVIILMLTLIQLRFAKKWVHYEN